MHAGPPWVHGHTGFHLAATLSLVPHPPWLPLQLLLQRVHVEVIAARSNRSNNVSAVQQALLRVCCVCKIACCCLEQNKA